MSTKDAVGNGNAAMKEAAMMSLSTEAADIAKSSARRTARAGARREPCMLNGHSSTKMGLELGSIGKESDVRAVVAGSTAKDGECTDPRVQGQETLAESGIVTVRAGGTAVLKAGSPIACATRHTATKVCYNPEPILTDRLSHE